MAVGVTPGERFEFRRATPLFELPGEPYFDVAPDGQRFLVNVPVGKPPPAALTLVLNWTQALKR